MKLTEAKIRAAVRAAIPGERRTLSDGSSLWLFIEPNGSALWRWRYRWEGVPSMLSLGAYPEVSLKAARDARDDARKLLKSGKNPAAVRRQTKATADNTFEPVARCWHEHWKAGRSAGYAAYVLRRLEADAFPALGKEPVGAITSAAFRDVVQKVEQRGAGEIAKRLLQNCGQIMRYAVARDLAPRNPVADIKPGDVLQRRVRRNYPRVTAKELPALLQAIDGYVGTEHTRLALQMMVLCFVRTGELIGARWEEFDIPNARWQIPARRMKMKTPHIVPLSRQALAILARLKEISFGRELVFPGDLNPRKPMSNNTMLFALYRLGYRGRMTGHGFRGVASTILHEQGWPHEHIELQLAHQERDEVSAAYNYAQYLKPRTKLMQAWADYLDGLRSGGNVTPIRRSA